jgi:Icc-related predicted phosphoesterase
MKILACSDLHGFENTYHWIYTLCEELYPDLITISGDLFGFFGNFSSVELAQQNDAKKLKTILSGLTIPVLFIMGNDDFITFKPELEYVHNIHGSRFEFRGFNFIGYHYSLPFIGGIFEKPEPAIESDLAGIKELVNEKTIFVTHSPAFGILDLSSSGIHIGSKSILNFVEKHKIYMHIHGHCHEGFGNTGIHFNVAVGGRMRAMLIDLDDLSYQKLEANDRTFNKM